MTDLLPVTQADRDRVQAFHSAMLDKLMTAVKDKAAGSRFGEDEGDAGTLVQMFAAHRIAATPAPDSEKLREAHDSLVETADYLIDSYQRLWRGGVVRDLAEAEGAYQAAKDFMALTLGASA